MSHAHRYQSNPTQYPPGSIYPRLYAQPMPDAPTQPPASDNLNNLLAIDLQTIWHWLAARRTLILACVIIGACMAMAFSVVTPPRFAVTTELLIDPTNLRVVTDDLFAQSEQRDTQLLAAESKIRVLTSKNVLTRTISELDLTEDPEFSSSPGIISQLLGAKPSTESPQNVALRALAKRVTARRDERSFLVTLSVWSLDPEKSVRISNSIVEAFKNELAEADADGARRAAEGLIQRLGELKTSVSDAEAAVEDFKRENNLQSNAGELMSNSQLTALNTQVLEAQRQLTDARSRYDIILKSANNSASAAQLDSPAINALRTQRSELVQQSSALSATFGPLHPRVVELQPQLAAIDTEIRGELERLKEAARNEVDRAQTAVEELVARASLQGSTVYSENDAQVALRELERDAAAKAAIYENFLARARQVAERQQLDTTNIRVISNPIVPRKRSWPPSTSQLLILGGAIGLSIGAVLAFGLGLAGQLRTNR